MTTVRDGHQGHGRPIRPLIVAAIVVMALVVPAGNTLALAFDPGLSRQISSSGDGVAFQRGLARTVPGSAVVVYQDRIGGHPAIFRRLTQDDGTSWGPRSRLSGVSVRQAARPAVAADGMAVDVVWVEGRRCDAASCRLRIATSGDGGSTFGTTKTLSSDGSPGLVQVARRGQLVVVAWTDWATGKILVRSSTDGAETFGNSIVLGTSRNKPYLDTRREARVTLGIGGGMVYALYFIRDGAARMRRSDDDGQTWRSTQVISDKANGSAGGSVVAGPDDALLAYSRYSARKARTRVVTRSTVNDGSDWTPAVLALSPFAEPIVFAGEPVVDRKWNGSYQLAFTTCVNSSCRSWRLHVLDTIDRGATWPYGYLAGGGPAQFLFPAAIDWEGHPLVLFVHLSRQGRVANVYAQFAQDYTPPPTPAGARKRRR